MTGELLVSREPLPTHVASFDVLLSSRTAAPIAELARAITAALVDAGSHARIVQDRLPPVREDRATVVVGPHDVYPHLDGGDGRGLTAVLARSILVACTRPVGSSWDADVRYAAKAGSVLHVSDSGVAAFRHLGLSAHRLVLGHHETLDRWRCAPVERPVDVAFMGSTTARRERIIAAAADVLADASTDIRLTTGVASAQAPVLDFVSGSEKLELLARAKLLLNVHPTDDLSFEWLRALGALCNGCVLISEESLAVAPLETGRHLVTATAGSLPALIDVLLRDGARLAELREAAYRLLHDELPLRRGVERIVELGGTLPSPAPHGRSFAPLAGDAASALRSASRDHPEARPPVALEEDASGPLSRQNAVLKKLFFDLRLLRRQVAHIAHRIERPEAPLVETTATPSAGASQPDVSVIVTVHNYARFVREALLSVARSQGVRVEAIVVDDASIDDSVAVIRQFMEEHPGVPLTLFEQKVNTGVQRARNLAFSHARAPFAFVLDADNAVYPRGLLKLREALQEDPDAAFAFGLIERFDETRSVGIMGAQGWDVGLLARTNYIDAMALVRVDAFKRVGGYVTDPLLELGWEDYDLWLSFAVAGLHGVHVREIIGRYRLHGVSSLTMTTLDTDDLMSKLRQRHAPFFAQAFEGEG
jgi:Glycosyl transferase family 2